MKCRRLVDGNVVWFGSVGVDDQGKAIKAQDFDNDLAGLAQTLTQQLSVMRTELWHNVSFGLPLLDKKRSKKLLDNAVADIVLSNENVLGIKSFESNISQSVYSCNLVINSTFGQIIVAI